MKKETKMILAAVGIGVAGGVAGAWLMKNNINSTLFHKEMELEHTLVDAKGMIRDISGQVDKAVKSVYNTEAKKAFEKRLDSIDNKMLVEWANEAIEANADDVLEKVLDKVDAKSVVKEYIEDNSVYFERKINKGIRDLFDDEFVDDITKAIKEKIKED